MGRVRTSGRNLPCWREWGIRIFRGALPFSALVHQVMRETPKRPSVLLLLGKRFPRVTETVDLGNNLEQFERVLLGIRKWNGVGVTFPLGYCDPRKRGAPCQSCPPPAAPHAVQNLGEVKLSGCGANLLRPGPPGYTWVVWSTYTFIFNSSPVLGKLRPLCKAEGILLNTETFYRKNSPL